MLCRIRILPAADDLRNPGQKVIAAQRRIVIILKAVGGKACLQIFHDENAAMRQNRE